MTDQSDTPTDAELGRVEAGTDRRALFAKAGAAAAVAAVVGLGSSRRVSAANGDTMNIGTSHIGTLDTKLSGGTTFWVANGTSERSASVYGSQDGSSGNYGVRGDHDGSQGIGVYGRSASSAGVGVFGENVGSGGLGVHGKADGSGGVGVLGETDGINGAGVRGRANGSGSNGVYGFANNADGAGVKGEQSESGTIGVYGHHSSTSTSGIGVRGHATFGTGVQGSGSAFDLLANGSGRIGLASAGNSGGTAQNAAIGTIARDAAGNLWYCYAANLWQRLGGPAAAGAFHAITPVRAFDSRIGAVPASGTFAANSVRKISVKDGRDSVTGVVTAADAVPAGAKAIAYNVTSTATTAPSFLAVVPGDVVVSAVSSLNWSGPGASIANAGIVGIDGNRDVAIIAGPGGTFESIIDITGYFL